MFLRENKIRKNENDATTYLNDEIGVSRLEFKVFCWVERALILSVAISSSIGVDLTRIRRLHSNDWLAKNKHKVLRMFTEI